MQLSTNTQPYPLVFMTLLESVQLPPVELAQNPSTPVTGIYKIYGTFTISKTDLLDTIARSHPWKVEFTHGPTYPKSYFRDYQSAQLFLHNKLAEHHATDFSIHSKP